MVAAGRRRGTTRPAGGQTPPMGAVDLVWGTQEHVAVDGVGIHVESAGPEDGVAV